MATVTVAARRRTIVNLSVPRERGVNEACAHESALIVRSTRIPRSLTVRLPALSSPDARSVYRPSGTTAPAAFRPSHVQSFRVAAVNAQLLIVVPALSMIRTLPSIGSSTRRTRPIVSYGPLPSGDRNDDGCDARPATAARRSTVTSFATDALLFEMSAAQTVIR